MNKHTKKLRKKNYSNKKTKHTHTNRKHKRNTKSLTNKNYKIEQRFKNLNPNIIKELQSKFKKERLLLSNKRIVNREQIGCANTNSTMLGGSNMVSDVFQQIEDYATGSYNNFYGYTHQPSQSPLDQPGLATSTYM